MIGTDPRPFSLRQLIHMTTGKQFTFNSVLNIVGGLLGKKGKKALDKAKPKSMNEVLGKLNASQFTSPRSKLPE